MKSLLFKSAWNIVKINGVSFSEALKTAWKAYKNGVKIVITESWNKIKRIAFSKNGSQNGSIELVMNSVKSIVNNCGAKHYYDGITFNND